MPLPRFPLGRTGLQVASLGLGTVKWGRNEGVKYGPFELPSDLVLEELLDLAQAAGINVIDIAPAYGLAEERVGKLLGSRREQFHLFTKTGERFEHGRSTYDFSAEATRASVETSLRRLKADRLDAVQVHCPANDLETLRDSPVLETLAQLKEEGKIRLIGASTMTVEGGLFAAEHCDLLMVAFNYGFHEQVPVIEAAARNGCGITLKKVFYSGQLPDPSQLQGESPAAYCLKSALALPGHPVVIVGTITPAHLAENVGAIG